MAGFCALSACGGPTPSAAAPDPSSEVAVSSGVQAPAQPQPVGTTMFKHFLRVAALERAVIEGDDEAIREHATELGKPRADDPPEWKTQVGYLERAAASVLTARNHREVAIATATVVAQCGRCHEAFSVTIDEGERADLPGRVSVAQKMERHQWATDRMRTGIVFASDVLWRRGAKALSESVLHPSEIGGAGPLDPEISEIIAHVRQLAREAQSAPAEHRQGIYGAVLGTCVRCHQKLR